VGWRFWRWKQYDSDVDEEIAYDLAADAEERIRSGIPREEAEFARWPNTASNDRANPP
jgi:hypothetical protein